jgi:hypothetical protein
MFSAASSLPSNCLLLKTVYRRALRGRILLVNFSERRQSLSLIVYDYKQTVQPIEADVFPKGWR